VCEMDGSGILALLEVRVLTDQSYLARSFTGVDLGNWHLDRSMDHSGYFA